MLNFTRLDPAKCEFISIGPASDLPNGERLFVEIDGRTIVVFNLGEQLYAIGDVCSHDDGPLGDGKLEDGKVICPRHGARFDLHTGKALSLPAVVDIPAYPVRIVSGEIEIGIPVG